MGAFDQFKDKANEFTEKGKRAAGEQRDKAADADNPREMAERGAQQGQERRSDFEDQAQERLDSESDDSDNWS
jgi:hypothetical protein